jgi:hypothetical protein
MVPHVAHSRPDPPEALLSAPKGSSRPSLIPAHLANGSVDAPMTAGTTATARSRDIRSRNRVLAKKDTGNARVTTHAPPDAQPTDDLTDHPPNDQNRPRLYPLILEILVEGGEIVHSGNDARTAFAAGNAGRAANHVYNVFIKILKIIGLIQMYTGARLVPSVKSTAGVGPATLEAGMVPTLPSRPMHAHLAPQVAPFVAVNLQERLARPELENPVAFKIDVDSANEVSVPRRPYIPNRANPSPETNPTK